MESHFFWEKMYGGRSECLTKMYSTVRWDLLNILIECASLSLTLTVLVALGKRLQWGAAPQIRQLGF